MTDPNPIVINFQNVKLYDDELIIFMPINGKIMAFSVPALGVKARFEHELHVITKTNQEPKA